MEVWFHLEPWPHCFTNEFITSTIFRVIVIRPQFPYKVYKCASKFHSFSQKPTTLQIYLTASYQLWRQLKML